MAINHEHRMMGWIEVSIRPIFVVWKVKSLVVSGNYDGAYR
jgi:hypothetical protein